MEEEIYGVEGRRQSFLRSVIIQIFNQAIHFPVLIVCSLQLRVAIWLLVTGF